jgi:hypothetical protein
MRECECECECVSLKYDRNAILDRAKCIWVGYWKLPTLGMPAAVLCGYGAKNGTGDYTRLKTCRPHEHIVLGRITRLTMPNNRSKRRPQ